MVKDFNLKEGTYLLMVMTYNEDLARLAISSAFNETKLREGRYKTIQELSSIYQAYMEPRLRDMLNPEKKIPHQGSLSAYDCTLELIKTTMDHLGKLDTNEESKMSMMKTLEKDYEKVEKMKEKFRRRFK